jgi:hypothetical protein
LESDKKIWAQREDLSRFYCRRLHKIATHALLTVKYRTFQKKGTVDCNYKFFDIISLLTWMNSTKEKAILLVHDNAFNIYIADSDIFTLTIQKVGTVHL